MDSTRRQFLYKTTEVGLLLALNPLEVFANIKSEPKNHQLSLDAYVDKIEGDRISQSYYKNPANNLFLKAIEKVKLFYENIGKQYGLSGVDLDTRLKKGELSGEFKNLGRYSMEFYYTSVDKLEKFYREDIDRLFFDIGGFEYINRLGDIIENSIKEDKVLKSLNLTKNQKEIVKNQIKMRKFENELGYIKGKGGLGSMHSRRAYVFPLSNDIYDTLKDYELELINLFGFFIAHEIGHVLSLDHPKPSGSFGHKNLMGIDVNSIEIIDVIKMDIKLAEAQVRQINEYLKN